MRKWSSGNGRERARKSKKQVLQKAFLETVKLSKHLILKKKENLKKKHLEKTHKILDTCRQYGGPLTISTIQNVQKLNEKQLLAEIGYLRHTTYPNIRQQEQVRDASGKVKLKKLDSAELKMNIINSIKPESSVVSNIEEVLKMNM